ncbi:hypothetical protein TH66_19270 [Carbonactinospora thermoautotrophica]|uniref:Sulfite exporter TauE/SafE n=1 Tax=Carbonactinospora thermoautotrophica TaxID=1469144 RepID=A0A132MIU0_9ACTN|nr:sulfite exporter TauE/SafE family protein [Carbonactinospora thermoautotrophica]KWW97675.1 hypothetical protein TH66_19270 [Carbonactinospora thermoautotrophica]KWX03942.1 hypothetical protein TR74_24490 [Carbonactinospora thermoautotrophica]
MSVVTLFATGLAAGLVAGGASCAAVQGGLLVGVVGRRRASSRLSEDGRGGVLTPVAAFLAAKLVSHTLAGAALGLLGAAVQPGPRARAVLLVLAGILMAVFALDMLGVPAVRRITPRPPQAWGRRVRASAKSTSWATPAVLGFLTVLIPCGVTLSMELLAITSGSLLGGAAVMAGFVLGTSPLFVALGYVLRASTRILQGRLTLAAGVLVLAVAAWTVTSGLRLGGWLPGDAVVATNTGQAVQITTDNQQIITIRAEETSYEPTTVLARAGLPTTLVIRTDNAQGCTRTFVIPALGVQQILPETGDTRINLGTPKAGTLDYSCGMGMYGGRITFQETTP